MKCENELKIGDVIKSLDFINDDNCYFIGKIVHIDEDVGEFRAKTISRIWGGKEVGSDHEYFVSALPGRMLLDDLGTRITVIA